MANSVLVLNGYQGLGTFFWVELFLREGEQLDNMQSVQIFLKETITSFNDTYSRFKEESLLSELNRNRIVAYNHHLANMITQALDASRITNDIFSIYIKEALEDRGYGKRSSQETAANKGEPSSVEINEKTITLKGNRGIDLGGIGKGYLIDILAEGLREKFGLKYFVINGGGDIYVTSNHGSPSSSTLSIQSIKVNILVQ